MTKKVKSIPENWYIKRTQKNAEILNSWSTNKLFNKMDIFLHPNKRFYSCPQVYEDKYRPFFDEHSIEITFEQWQSIPEVAEWLKTHNMENFLKTVPLHNGEMPTKVKEREIIGYESPRDYQIWNMKAGDIILISKSKNKIIGYGFNGHSIPFELVETWRPKYKEEKTVLKSYWEVYQTDEFLPLSTWVSEAEANEEIRKNAVLGKKYFVKEIQYLSKDV